MSISADCTVIPATPFFCHNYATFTEIWVNFSERCTFMEKTKALHHCGNYCALHCVTQCVYRTVSYRKNVKRNGFKDIGTALLYSCQPFRCRSCFDKCRGQNYISFPDHTPNLSHPAPSNSSRSVACVPISPLARMSVCSSLLQ